MQRRVFFIAFTLTFSGLLALGAGWTTPAEGQASGPAPKPAPSWIVLPANPPDSSFGKQLPDGTWCGALCEAGSE